MTKYSYLATPSATAEVLSNFGIGLKKSLGQNFLVNDRIVGKILELSQIQGSDSVLEVGPGIGTLTAALLGVGASVVSVERDASLFDVLSETLNQWSYKFALIRKDALYVSEKDIQNACSSIQALLPNMMVANLPYAVAATVILDYFERFSFLQSQTVMVQKEVAERICAQPGTKIYGAYTVKLAFYAKATGRFNVSAGNFMPPPHVESTVVHLERRSVFDEHGDEASAELLKAAAQVTDAAFASRRKTILNSMKSYFLAAGDKDAAHALEGIINAADIDPKCRGEVLAPSDYVRLGNAYLNYKSDAASRP